MSQRDAVNSVDVRWRSAGATTVYGVASVRPSADPEQAATEAYSRIVPSLIADGLVIVQERIFGSGGAEPAILAARRRALPSPGLPPDTPLTFVEGGPAGAAGLAGVIVRAVRRAALAEDVWTVFDGDVPAGRGWREGGQTHLILQAIAGCPAEEPCLSHAEQTAQMIRRAERLLRGQSGTYRDVVRTWFYLRDILGWYDTFNAVRSEEYKRFGLLPVEQDTVLRLPASTGIEGKPSRGAAAILDLYAIVGSAESPRCVEQLRNTVQRDAFEYGSAFSRGAIVRGRGGSILQLSGTAAIDECGRSLYPGDAAAQMQCALDKIEALLRPIGAGLGDICAATVFLKRSADYPVWRDIAEGRGLRDLPSVCVLADVCRDELLFEMDAEIALASCPAG